jgi:hypothetical protein
MRRATHDQKTEIGALISLLLMLFWGQAPTVRRPPRVIIERFER